ncbi:MAG: VCBS repeat-containing protein [Planctomycetes bacterium]|nr:VCBS repeat-containing protein [Planctomycetota bacterium]
MLLLNTGPAGGWLVQKAVAFARSGPGYAIALDVDRDGDVDVITVNSEYCVVPSPAPRNFLWLNDGSAGFTIVSPAVFPDDVSIASSVVAFDCDGDGDADVVVGNKVSANTLYLNDGKQPATFTRVAPHDAVDEVKVASVTVADVDRDGSLDLVLTFPDAGCRNGPARLLTNRGSGRFDTVALPVPLGTAGYWTTSDAGVGDLDGDGWEDILVATPDASTPLLMFSRVGSGPWVRAFAGSLTTQTMNAYSIALVDVDGDGDLDVFIGNSGQDELYLRTGTTFTRSTSLPVLTGTTTSIAAADFTGDGNVDLLLATNTAPRLLAGSPSGVFTDVTSTYLPSATALRRVAAGDLDGVPGVDFAAVTLAGDVVVGRNAGPGKPFVVTPITLPGKAKCVAIGDIDGDGAADLVVGGEVAVRTVFLRGNGSGGFTIWHTLDQQVVIPVAVRAAAVLDFDRDGDLDVVLAWGDDPGSGVTYGGPLRFLTNTTRNLSARGPIREGKTFHMQYHGPQGTAITAIALSVLAMPVDLGGLGVLQIDPARMILLPGVAIPASNAAALRVPIPANTMLLGQNLHWQAIAGTRLTGPESTRITGY